MEPSGCQEPPQSRPARRTMQLIECGSAVFTAYTADQEGLSPQPCRHCRSLRIVAQSNGVPHVLPCYRQSPTRGPTCYVRLAWPAPCSGGTAAARLRVPPRCPPPCAAGRPPPPPRESRAEAAPQTGTATAARDAPEPCTPAPPGRCPAPVRQGSRAVCDAHSRRRCRRGSAVAVMQQKHAGSAAAAGALSLTSPSCERTSVSRSSPRAVMQAGCWSAASRDEPSDSSVPGSPDALSAYGRLCRVRLRRVVRPA